jgi:hypothetical protein
MSDITLSFKDEQCSGGKKSEERVTVMVGCNADESQKLPLFLIGEVYIRAALKMLKNYQQNILLIEKHG